MEIGLFCYNDLLQSILNNSNRNDPLVSYEFELIKATLEVEGIYIELRVFGVALITPQRTKTEAINLCLPNEETSGAYAQLFLLHFSRRDQGLH